MNHSSLFDSDMNNGYVQQHAKQNVYPPNYVNSNDNCNWSQPSQPSQSSQQRQQQQRQQAAYGKPSVAATTQPNKSQ